MSGSGVGGEADGGGRELNAGPDPQSAAELVARADEDAHLQLEVERASRPK